MSAPLSALSLRPPSTRWRAPITALLVVLAAVGVVVQAVASTPSVGYVPIDYSLFGPLGADILQGRWDSIFSDKIVQAGALELIFWGIPDLIGVEGQVGWIILSVVGATIFAIVVSAVAERMLRAHTSTWSVPLAVGISAVASLTGLYTLAITSGHPAQVVVTLLWIVAARLAMRGRAAGAAAVIASTAGWELWGLLAIPLLLLLPRIDVRAVVRAGIAGLAVVLALYGPFLLLGPFRMFDYRWEVRDTSLAHLLFPESDSFPWQLRLIQGGLTIGAGIAATVLLRGRTEAVWLPMLLVDAVRLATDPVLGRYYGVSPALLLLVGIAFAIAFRSWVVLLVSLIGLNVIIDLPLTFASMTALTLLGVITLVAVRRQRDRLPHPVA